MKLIHKWSDNYRNYTFEGLRDSEIREDYFILLCFICLYGGEDFPLEGYKAKSQALNSLNYLGEKP